MIQNIIFIIMMMMMMMMVVANYHNNRYRHRPSLSFFSIQMTEPMILHKSMLVRVQSPLQLSKSMAPYHSLGPLIPACDLHQWPLMQQLM